MPPDSYSPEEQQIVQLLQSLSTNLPEPPAGFLDKLREDSLQEFLRQRPAAPATAAAAVPGEVATPVRTAAPQQRAARLSWPRFVLILSTAALWLISLCLPAPGPELGVAINLAVNSRPQTIAYSDNGRLSGLEFQSDNNWTLVSADALSPDLYGYFAKSEVSADRMLGGRLYDPTAAWAAPAATPPPPREPMPAREKAPLAELDGFAEVRNEPDALVANNSRSGDSQLRQQTFSRKSGTSPEPTKMSVMSGQQGIGGGSPDLGDSAVNDDAPATQDFATDLENGMPENSKGFGSESLNRLSHLADLGERFEAYPAEEVAGNLLRLIQIEDPEAIRKFIRSRPVSQEMIEGRPVNVYVVEWFRKNEGKAEPVRLTVKVDALDNRLLLLSRLDPAPPETFAGGQQLAMAQSRSRGGVETFDVNRDGVSHSEAVEAGPSAPAPLARNYETLKSGVAMNSSPPGASRATRAANPRIEDSTAANPSALKPDAVADTEQPAQMVQLGLMYHVGDVYRNSIAQGELKKIEEPAQIGLFAGDYIKTSGSGPNFVTANLNNNAQIIMGPGTEVRFLTANKLNLMSGEMCLELTPEVQMEVLGPARSILSKQQLKDNAILAESDPNRLLFNSASVEELQSRTLLIDQKKEGPARPVESQRHFLFANTRRFEMQDSPFQWFSPYQSLSKKLAKEPPQAQQPVNERQPALKRQKS